MHDWSLAYFSRSVRDVRHNPHHDKPMGRAGPVAWTPHSHHFHLLGFYLWGHLKPECIQLQLKTKRHFTNVLLMPLKPLAIAPRPLKGCDSPRSDVSMGALM
jgi:hypothetical protein